MVHRQTAAQANPLCLRVSTTTLCIWCWLLTHIIVIAHFHRAAHDASPEAVAILILYGAGLKYYDKAGRSPLHYACGAKNPANYEVVKLLLEAKEDLNVKDGRGERVTEELLIKADVLEKDNVR